MDQVKFDARKVTIRPMAPSDVVPAVDCFSDHSDVFDAPVTVDAFLRTYPEAFYVATIQSGQNDSQEEEVIGVCACPIGPQNIAFFGLYGLRVGYRAFGIGSRLFQRCLDYIGPQRSVGLFAVPEMRQKYMERGGFTTREGVSMVNYVGTPSDSNFDAFNAIVKDSSIDVRFLGEDSATLLENIIEYDYKIHLETRKPLLNNALPSTGYTTCAVFEGGLIKGYGCVREHSRSGRLMIGPLYSDTPTIARHLSAHLLCHLPREKITTNGVIINAVDAQPESLKLATEWIGLDEIERCERLFRGSPIKANYELIYGVFSLDFAL